MQVQNVTAEYIMKCDDDTFVRLDVVLQQVSTFNRTLPLYLGNLNLLHRPLRSGKWAVTFEVHFVSHNVNPYTYSCALHTTQTPAGMARIGVSPLCQRTRLRNFDWYCQKHRVPSRKSVTKGKIFTLTVLPRISVPLVLPYQYLIISP